MDIVVPFSCVQRNDVGCAHVVHQAKGVTDFVFDDVHQGVAEDFLRDVGRADVLIRLGGLDEDPGAQ